MTSNEVIELSEVIARIEAINVALKKVIQGEMDFKRTVEVCRVTFDLINHIEIAQAEIQVDMRMVELSNGDIKVASDRQLSATLGAEIARNVKFAIDEQSIDYSRNVMRMRKSIFILKIPGRE